MLVGKFRDPNPSDEIFQYFFIGNEQKIIDCFALPVWLDFIFPKSWINRTSHNTA